MADLERQLGRALAPVQAPEGLWNAIHRPREARPARRFMEWALWPAAAVVLMLALAGVLRSHTLDQPAPSPEASAAANCHTPVYAVKDLRTNARSGCLACHLTVPGSIFLNLP